ncbi:MAG: SDR family oxidoreductase [Pseudomonadota bacterium]
MDLSGKSALVTGAAQGLGAAIADCLADRGAHVFRSDIKPGQGLLAHDVSDEASWQTVLDDVKADAGALHILVNNAGIEGAPDAPKDPEGTPLEDWEAIFSVNARGTFLGCKHAMALMAASGGGAITNLASVAALVPTPFITAYGASKAAVAHLTRTVALHAAQQGYAIRANAVYPGQIRTPMLNDLFGRWALEQGIGAEEVAESFRQTIPLKAFQEPRDIAETVAYLSSDLARYVTGQNIAVDGGFSLVN